MYLTATIHSQLLRRLEAASPSYGARIGDAASCRVSLVHGVRINVPDSHHPFANPLQSRGSATRPCYGIPNPIAAIGWRGA